MCTYVCVCMYVYMCMCMCIYISLSLSLYIYIYIYTSPLACPRVEPGADGHARARAVPARRVRLAAQVLQHAQGAGGF